MTRWEYRLVEIVAPTEGPYLQHAERTLNELGADGWELVEVDVVGWWRLLLKRPLGMDGWQHVAEAVRSLRGSR